MQKKWEHLLDGVIITLVVLWTIYLFNHDPRILIEEIGVNNGYILSFFTSLLGGIATFTVVSVYPTIIGFAIGGLNPIILGLIAGIGLTIGNIVFYYLGLKGRGLSSQRFQEKIESVIRWVNRAPDWTLPIFIWLYVGLTPFPNNLLTMSGGLINISFRTMIIPLLLGNFTLMTILAYIAQKGVELF